MDGLSLMYLLGILVVLFGEKVLTIKEGFYFSTDSSWILKTGVPRP